MNFDEIVVKESPGLCRCCLSEGCYKDVGTEYTWMNENEVYADMLLECFDISISQHTDGPNGSNRLICEVCITRLRDACNFKKQVLDSEKKFVDMLARGEFQPKVIMYQAGPMKTEEILEESVDDADVEYLEDMDLDDDLPLNQVGQSLEASASDVKSSLKLTRKRGRPKKPTTPVKTEKKPKLKLEVKPRTSKAVPKGGQAQTMTSNKRNRLMKRNAIIIIENTTVLPFKWHRQNYLCFYCNKDFKKTSHLKEHYSEHLKPNVKSAVLYLRRDEKVKVDITDATCRICQENILFDEITQHLTLHGKIFAEEVTLGIVPYRLADESFECGLCDEKFQYFVKLNQHMNGHYGFYVCESCGKSFLSQDRLRSHMLSHGSGFHCTMCSEVFDSLTQVNQHKVKVHSLNKSFKCLYCDESFANCNKRKLHHIKAHNIQTLEYFCPVCSKKFLIESKMKTHYKQVHLREKNFSCTMCDQRFFSKTHVQKHMIKHFGERIHACDVCKKSYARKQTLRDHMKIHNDVKRFSCDVCGQGFVQSNSLKLHLKLHHQGLKED